MRNISVQDRVVSNTKVIMREVGRKFVTVETLPERRQVLPDRVSLHAAPEWSDSGTEAVPTPAVLCDHGQQVAGQTLKKVCVDVREHPFAHLIS